VHVLENYSNQYFRFNISYNSDFVLPCKLNSSSTEHRVRVQVKTEHAGIKYVWDWPDVVWTRVKKGKSFP
jgi:hypothetical protein